jgi:hypothetical protein
MFVAGWGIFGCFGVYFWGFWGLGTGFGVGGPAGVLDGVRGSGGCFWRVLGSGTGF